MVPEDQQTVPFYFLIAQEVVIILPIEFVLREADVSLADRSLLEWRLENVSTQ